MGEVHFNQDSEDRSKWYAASDDKMWTERLKKVGARLVKVRGDTHFFELDDEQVHVRAKLAKRVLTDEQREASRQRMLALHAKKTSAAANMPEVMSPSEYGKGLPGDEE